MKKMKLSAGWEFCLDERTSKEKTAPKTGFRPVMLPHDWSTDYPFDPDADTCGSGGYARAGIGWYRRTLEIPAFSPDEQVILYFEGAYMKSSVYVNGSYAGGHVYGYTPFEVDITDLVREGENSVLVRVDNSMQPGSRWYSGSGITRNVWLEIRNQVHIARYGMYLTTECGEANAKLKIRMTLHAPKETALKMAKTKGLAAVFCLKDAEGNAAAQTEIRLDGDWEAADADAAVLSGIDRKQKTDRDRNIDGEPNLSFRFRSRCSGITKIRIGIIWLRF